METLVQKSARFEFARRAEISADLRQRLLLEMNTRVRAEQDKTARETERRRDTEFVMALQGALAPPQKIAEFTVKLDRYDTATVQALMDNERDILDVREKIDGMLLKAHVVNGRRVFKTEDGNRVFDEFGAELKADEITPDAIDNAKPRWEAFSAARDEEKRLVQERKDLGDYQEKLDRARERTKDPKLTEDELLALDKELGNGMPERVRKLTGEPKPNQQRDLAANATPDTAPPIPDPNRATMTPATFQP